ncbi:serine/threonine-protein kinase/endoribonuclease IRE2-like [Mercenaria mercenaria]|uniref:serine/threonine-protein kinase/endoribonuclease IRE2-like n=1 Tax=Mercenaria mercenaria TaxID=6596 RepID=UPI001E1DA8B6|nr:serine/threonine-protein kinase/endoribonuclease IRE2-like [Mercenaria mercenaria]
MSGILFFEAYFTCACIGAGIGACIGACISAVIKINNITEIVEKLTRRLTTEPSHENENSRNEESGLNCSGRILTTTNKVQPPKKITYDSKKPIGMSHATVFEGLFENDMIVAVKRVHIDTDDTDQIINEYKHLQKKLRRQIDINHKIMKSGHENVTKYYGYQIEGTHLLYALELCNYHLEEFLLHHRHNCPPILDTDILLSMAKGLDFLHSKDIVHRDLKPSNVLMKIENNNVIVKLSDFGMSKTLPETSSVASGSSESGTLGWMAPEVYIALEDLNTEIQFSRKSDIFPLGLLFYFVASGGKYVFNTQDDIQNKNATYTGVVANDPLFNLVKDMHSPAPTDRPSAQEVKNHPALWNMEKVLDFYKKTSNLSMGLPVNNAPFTKNPIQVITGTGNQMIPCQPFDWYQKLTLSVQQDLFPNVYGRRSHHGKGKGPRYDRLSVDSLIRAIRNNNEHYYELSINLQNEYGSYPTGFLNYWTTKFPGLLMYAYDAMKLHSGDGSMAKFYE